jgi:gas vesicle protein
MKYFLAGIGLGFGIGILLAPSRGEETREQLMDRASELTGNLRGQFGNAVRNSGQVLRDTQEKLSGLGQQVTDQLQTKGQQLREVVQNKFSGGALLNSVSREDLLGIYGIGPVMADKILANRPYTSDRQIVEQGIIPEGIFDRLERELLKKQA